MRAVLDQLAAAVGGSGNRQVIGIPLEAIDPDSDQPRKSFGGIDELAASIRAVGIRQPLLVRAHPEDVGRYVLVAGERRYRAASQAGLDEVPCLVEEDIDRGRRLIIQLTENLQREDVAVLETARALEVALKELGVSKAELAYLLGKKAPFVSKHLALLRSEGPGREALEEGWIRSPETHRVFASLEPAEQARLLARARQEKRPIARGEVDQRRVARKKPKKPTRKTPSRSKRLRIELHPGEIAEILRRFGVEPPGRAARLVPALLGALKASARSAEEVPSGSEPGAEAGVAEEVAAS